MENPPQEKDNTAVLTTQVFKIELAAIQRVAFIRTVSRWWWTAAVLVLAALIAGIVVDRRWLFLAPVLLCLVYPFLLAVAAWSLTATPALAQSMRPHYAVFYRAGVTIVPVPDDITPDSRVQHSVSASDVADTGLSGSNVLITLRDSSFILIPLDSVDDTDALINAADSLLNHRLIADKNNF